MLNSSFQSCYTFRYPWNFEMATECRIRVCKKLQPPIPTETEDEMIKRNMKEIGMYLQAHVYPTALEPRNLTNQKMLNAEEPIIDLSLIRPIRKAHVILADVMNKSRLLRDKRSNRYAKVPHKVQNWLMERNCKDSVDVSEKT